MKKNFFVMMFLSVLTLGGCGPATSVEPKNQAQTTYKKLTPEKAKEMIGGNKDIILVDVRTPSEFEEARIEGSILIPDYDIETLAPKMLPDKTATILVYCRSGRRSMAAAEKLIRLGYTDVYDFGGIIDWPYETISGKE